MPVFGEEANQLRQAIRRSIQEHLAAFEERTGVVPSAIRIEMVDTSTVNRHQFIIGEVRLEFRV